MLNGKTDKPRDPHRVIVSRQQFSDNWDMIFGKKDKDEDDIVEDDGYAELSDCVLERIKIKTHNVY